MAKGPKEFHATTPSEGGAEDGLSILRNAAPKSYRDASRSGGLEDFWRKNPQLLSKFEAERASVANATEKHNQTTVFDPKDSERNFAVALTAYGAMFGTGLLQIAAHDWYFGPIFTIGGGLGLISVAPILRPKLEAMRSTRSLWAVITVTCILLAANIFLSVYDRLSGQHAASVQQKIEQPEANNILDVTPTDLMALYKEGTSYQGDKLLEPYIGKWMRLTQTVSDVKANSVWTYLREKPDSEPQLILLLFDNDAQSGTLRQNQKISALCQIAAAKVNQLYLVHCRLGNK